MKKLVLILFLTFPLMSMNSANHIDFSTIKQPNINNVNNPADIKDNWKCWEEVNEKEAEFFGYVGCNYDYWLGYFEG